MLVWGFVRRFHTAKSYGFVDAGDGKGDILLHLNELRAFGVPSVAEGARVLVRVETTARGRQAVEVCDFRPPATTATPPGAGPLEPARVRWFDQVMGYGFVNVFGRPGDVFLHMATLREWGFGAIPEGHAIVVRVTAGRDGPTACEVRDWGYPNRLRGRRRASRRPIVMPASRPGRASADDRNLRAAAAILEVLRAGPHGGPRGRGRAGSRGGAAPSESGIEAILRLGYHIDHVDMIFAPVFGAK
jgi:CspA family cold shock protein